MRTFVLSDFEPTETVLESQAYLYYELYDFEKTGLDHKYYLKSQKKLQTEIDNFVFNINNSGGGGSYGGGAMNFQSQGEDYAFFYFVDYSEFFKTISSDAFFAMTFFMIIMFLAAGAIILFVSCKMYDKNQKLNEARRAFTSAAAHELKTPLTVIQNRCECVIENIAPEKNNEYVKSIYDEALRMNGIVQSLMTYNRLSDTTKINKTKIDLSSIVKQETEKYICFAETFDVNITAEIQENITTYADSELISMAVDNYLSNAVKYADGDKKVKITLTAKGKEFELCVYNDCSNCTEINNSVWDVLTRNDMVRNSSENSSGMGLPICKHIFRLHGYGYWFEINTGQICFCFGGKT